MKNAIKKCIFVCSVLCSAVFWSSCQDNLEYYDTPDNLKGSIYETLEDRGNYSIFLKGVDLGGYAPILKGKGVWTVMAPNDEAFASYLKSEYGVNSIEELSVDEIKKLIGFHIMYYSFDKNKLINFRPEEGDGATDDGQRRTLLQVPHKKSGRFDAGSRQRYDGSGRICLPFGAFPPGVFLSYVPDETYRCQV